MDSFSEEGTMDMVKFVSLVVAMTFAVSVVAKDGKLQDGTIDISKKHLAKISRAALISLHGEYRAKH